MKSISIAFSRFFVGCLFIFSGLIKANDPLGFGYKLQEYFEVFHLSFLNDYAVFIAIFLCGLEVMLGAALLLGIYAKKVIWGLLALILFFTFLTFYSAYFKVVTSCGCFGDAIPLTPWQSFGKDLILLAFILILFIYQEEINTFLPAKNQYLIFLLVFTLGFGPGIYTYRNLPFVDFLPYKKGADIPELMKIKKLNDLGSYDLIIDPGFGFGKTIDHNYEILQKLESFRILQIPVLAGFSRKSMIYKLLESSPAEALNGTSVCNTIALLKGAKILRVHDVKPAMEAIQIVGAMEAAEGSGKNAYFSKQ